jgi:hypothetical protein
MKIQTSLKYLFVSQTRLKLISVLFYSPQEIFYVRQLVRLAYKVGQINNYAEGDIIMSEELY